MTADFHLQLHYCKTFKSNNLRIHTISRTFSISYCVSMNIICVLLNSQVFSKIYVELQWVRMRCCCVCALTYDTNKKLFHANTSLSKNINNTSAPRTNIKLFHNHTCQLHTSHILQNDSQGSTKNTLYYHSHTVIFKPILDDDCPYHKHAVTSTAE